MALINHERIDTDVHQFEEKIQLLPGYADDLSTATFCLFNEDHTIGNALRYILMKNGNVEFCGYSIPHPSEPKVHLRIQMYDNLSAIDALYKGLDDLESMFNEIEASYKTNLETEEHEKYVTKQMNLSAVKDMLNK
ncbi:RBP11-like subunits of RNA polymerase [Wallemia mellicola CBS 633.66]|uniref:DNA-directed RNA polymerases I and III subunit RPAC2 n=1 Tax=Wallemia mellicola (strain ATCC MYA-4683 / CBS 633.66) TaxID=671144 RepID=I4Y8T6_WALMC|nr:RBP11-like subunits of RNA polymerase [Wallemia mellicola CBS 633.66]EIM20378.1 RBP11-like subunits of RNA polymerase [Wallemia mellicola CBS 633.66]|eukprot:XP_006959635.1 RBP11-like subunits of RNA polymerase [Wallemia mellicola CBS 633.66]